MLHIIWNFTAFGMYKMKTIVYCTFSMCI